MLSICSEKPICTSPRLSEFPPAVPIFVQLTMTLSRPSTEIVERLLFLLFPSPALWQDKRHLTKYRRFAHILAGASETGRRSAQACFGLLKTTERGRPTENVITGVNFPWSDRHWRERDLGSHYHRHESPTGIPRSPCPTRRKQTLKMERKSRWMPKAEASVKRQEQTHGMKPPSDAMRWNRVSRFVQLRQWSLPAIASSPIDSLALHKSGLLCWPGNYKLVSLVSLKVGLWLYEIALPSYQCPFYFCGPST